MYCMISRLISVHGGGGMWGVIATPLSGCHAPSLLLKMSYEMYCMISCLISVHGGGGMWGVIATPLLAKDTGLFFTWSRQAFLVSDI